MVIDLVIWTLNGEKTLGKCLESVGRAIPREHICHRIAVDGCSRDGTRKILEDQGWQVLTTSPSIPGQANLALTKVDRPVFASFEQDIIIPKDWLRITEKLEPRVLAVTGFRVYDGAPTLRAINLYANRHSRRAWNYSIDNTVFNTEALRSLGGFPYGCPMSTDSLLREKALENGYRWEVDSRVITKHLRNGSYSAVKHDIRQTLRARLIWKNQSDQERPTRHFKMLGLPLTGGRIASEYHAPWAFPVYLWLRLSKIMILSLLRSRVRNIRY